VIYNGGSGVNELNPVSGDMIVNSSIILDNSVQLNVFGNNSHVLRLNGAVQNGASSTGSVSLNQNSVLIFNAANTYTGDTQINAGDLRFSINGSAASSIIRLGGTGANSPDAIVSLGTTSGADTGLNIGSTLVVRPSGSGTQGTRILRSIAPSGTNTYSGGIFLDADLTMQASTGGTLVISGTTDIKNHVLTVSDNSGNVNTQGNVVISGNLTSSLAAGGSLVLNDANTLDLQSLSNTYTGTNPLSLNANGTQIGGGGTLRIAGDGSLGLVPTGAYNNLQFTGNGTLQFANNTTLATTRNVSIANAATATIDTNGKLVTISGIVNGAGALTKISTGTLTLSNANTYGGGTTVNGGTLLVSNTTGSGTGSGMVQVNTGAIFGGGTTSGVGGVSGAVNVGTVGITATGGTISPGLSTGSTAILNTGNLAIGNAAHYLVDLNTLTPGTGYDMLNVTGSVTLSLGSILDVNSSLSLGPLDAAFIVVNDGLDPVVGLFTTVNAPAGFTVDYFADFGSGLLVGGNDIALVAVPEPGTWLAAALALGAVAFSQRRRIANRFAAR
jgi:autotransporter-associated beta strand protein